LRRRKRGEITLHTTDVSPPPETGTGDIADETRLAGAGNGDRRHYGRDTSRRRRRYRAFRGRSEIDDLVIDDLAARRSARPTVFSSRSSIAKSSFFDSPRGRRCLQQLVDEP